MSTSPRTVIPSIARDLAAIFCHRQQRADRDEPILVYILASSSRRLYVGVTNDLHRRVVEHKAGIGSTHTARYKIEHLVYAEEHPSIDDAIAREKQIKGWRRSKKLELIELANLGWVDQAARLDAEAREVRAANARPDPSLRSG